MSEIALQLRILEALECDPQTTQARLAAQLGVAVGSANWYLKRQIRKVTQMERRRRKYLVTQQGLTLKARLASQYLEASLPVYRELRRAARETLAEVRREGCTAFKIDGKDGMVVIFGLTSLEEGVHVEKNPAAAFPDVRSDGTGFVLEWPG